MTIFDVGIIGAGVAGSFACYKIAKEYKNTKVVIFDLGRPPMKRRRQLEGWLGCLPNSDGKLYTSDIDKVSELTGLRKAKSGFTQVNNILKNIEEFKTIKDRNPQVSLDKKIKKFGFDYYLNDYIQLYPQHIHALSKYMADLLEKNKNITFSFDNEVKQIYKQKNQFVVVTENQEFKCKKILLSVGRSGWRWCRDVFHSFGIIESNHTAKYGIRIEINSDLMKEYNKSNLTITKNNELEVGPFSWSGTVVPEDHVDFAISAFRSNENRWETDKVSFSLLGNRVFENNGYEQTSRLAKLTFILSNDRILKERVSYILQGKSKISIIPEYNWLKEAIQDLSNIMPELVSKAYFHVPTIMPLPPKINIGNNLETEIDGMFVAGESAGIHGILSAAITGAIAADNMLK